jgi:hypothetical protein
MQLFKNKEKFSELTNFVTKNQVGDKLQDTIDLLIKPKTFKSFQHIKSKGYTIKDIFTVLLILPFASICSVNALQKSNLKEFVTAGKDAFYDLKNNLNIDWRKLCYIFLKQSFRLIRKHGEENIKSLKCLIVDDTLLEKTGSKIENVSYVHDHITGDWLLGFKMLMLGFWDGKSFFGVDFSLHKESINTENKKLKKFKTNMFNKKRERSTPGYKRKKEMNQDKIENSLLMIKRAIKQGLVPNYVLADSWFISEKFVKEIRKQKKGTIHVIGMARQDRRKYLINRKEYSSKQIIAKYKCKAKTSRKLKMKYVALVCEYKGIPVKLFLVKQGLGNKGSWKIMLTTDPNLSFIKLMETYHIRWSIEVYFKEAKQYLALGESQSNDLDGQIADITMVMIRSILLTLMMRFEDYETTGELFRESQKELINRTLAVRIWELFIEFLRELFELINFDYEEFLSKSLQDEKAEQKFIAMMQALKEAA